MELAELHKLSASEKLRIIEELWSDLASAEDAVASPSWHARELGKTEEELRQGRIEPLDWEAAKRELRDKPSR